MRYLFSLFAILIAFHANSQHLFDYSDLRAGKFSQKTVSGVRSMSDGEHYTVVEDGKIVKYSYKTGHQDGVVFDAAEAGLPGGRIVTYTFSPDEKKILLPTARVPIYRRSYTADHYVYDIPSGELLKLTPEGGEQVPSFSPDGRRLAFVRDNDIYLTVPGSDETTRVTTDGLYNHIINGHTDWVYEEEFGFTRAYEFSPDGNRIAYIRFDESRVPEYSFDMFGRDLYPGRYTYKYPMAGEANSLVDIYLYDIVEGAALKIDTGTETDRYISRIGFTPAGNLFYYHSNRLQNSFSLMITDNDLVPCEAYAETDRRYVERPDDRTITFLEKSERFIVRNETSGYAHLYLWDAAKGVIDTLTRGNWEVTNIVSVTPDRVYYLSTEGSSLRRSLWSVKLNGKGKTKLSEEDGYWNVSPSKGFKYYISYFSNVSTPSQVRLHNSSGRVLRVLEDNADLKKYVAEKRIPRKEFFRFTTERGTTLNGYMIKPAGFDPAKKYPVLLSQYSGPGSQEVLDRWSMDWTDVLVQEGYVIVSVDGRGTGGRGAEFRKATYGKLGALETEDQISAAKYVATMDWADPSRIGIFGWSYGGFMALNSILKGADIFSMAIAVAPVTSWRFYDTIYTEIYNGLPKDNPAGYDNNSPINYAHLLKGKLLIIHGSADDNVHVRNSYRMAGALVRAGKQFDMMIYPDDNHSMVPSGRHHIMEKMIEYTMENL